MCRVRSVQPTVPRTVGCRTRTRVLIHTAPNKKGPHEGGPFYLVEAAGIEPASASNQQPALHT